jgi:hypothetical protein
MKAPLIFNRLVFGKLVFGMLVLAPYAAMANLACVESDGGTSQMSLQNIAPAKMKAVVTDAQGSSVTYLGSLNTSEPGVFSESAYDLMSVDGQKAKLTVTEMPSLMNHFCGRGICHEPKPPSSEKVISATLQFASNSLSFDCQAVIQALVAKAASDVGTKSLANP